MTSAAFIFMRVIGALRCGLSADLCGEKDAMQQTLV